MHHVDAQDRCGLHGRPVADGIQANGRPKVWEAGLGPPRSDRGKCVWVGIAGLPAESGESPGEVDGMLAAAARHFQHEPASRQRIAQHRDDGVTVA